MKLGDVLRKEREKRSLTSTQAAHRLCVTEDEYRDIEGGVSEAEVWGPRLAQIAIELSVATSRLLADSGRSADTRSGQAGALIRRHREARGKTAEEVAKAAGLDAETYRAVEEGTSPIERWGPLLLAFAETVEQPVFNLFYPCGLPFQELNDYP